MSRPRVCIPGAKFGKLTLIRRVGKRYKAWRVKCDCGCTFTTANAGSLAKSHRDSNGRFPRCARCSYDELLVKHPKHSEYEARLWRTLRWRAARKLVKIPTAWRKSFMAFYEDVGPCPPGHQFVRLDNRKPYSKENCAWLPKKRAQSRRNESRFIAANGQRLSQSAWAKKLGCSRQVIDMRLRNGWDPVRAVTTPVQKR